MPELRPGVFTALFAKVATETGVRTRLALESPAEAVERRAPTTSRGLGPLQRLTDRRGDTHVRR